jgi:hypothetical protein
MRDTSQLPYPQDGKRKSMINDLSELGSLAKDKYTKSVMKSLNPGWSDNESVTPRREKLDNDDSYFHDDRSLTPLHKQNIHESNGDVELFESTSKMLDTQSPPRHL